jgi:hypothetical protein
VSVPRRVDPLGDALLELVDVIPIVPLTSLTDLDMAIRGHPARQRFDGLLDADPLNALFSDVDAGFAFNSTGSGTLINRAALPAVLLLTPVQHAWLTGERLSRDTYMAAVRQGLLQLRDLVAGQDTPVRVVSAVNGIKIAPDIEIALPWGVMRRGPEADVGGTAHVAMVTTLKASYAVVPPGASPVAPPRLMDATQASAQRRREALTVLTILLGVSNGKPASQVIARRWLFPLDAQGSSATGGDQPSIYGTQAFVGRDEVAEVERWGQIVAQHYAPRLDVAVRRLVSAVSQRHDAADGLVDAMVAMESLFAGTSKSELTFRVAAAAAWLLEPADVDARRVLHKEVTKLYGLRSTIVHGGTVRSADQLPVQRDRAFALGRMALQALYARHPKLLTQDDRSLQLILGVDPEGPG